MPPQLLALSDGPNISLDKPIVLVGRHEECDIQIPSRKISRRHCCIAQVNDYVVVRDLYSTNGVQVNGTRVDFGVLHEGDELTIGNVKYRLSMNIPRSDDSARHRRNASLESCEMPVPLTDDDDEDAPRSTPVKKRTDIDAEEDPDSKPPNPAPPSFPKIQFRANDSSLQNSSVH